MNIKISTLLYFLVLTNFVYAQNLVPNASFEDLTSCPSFTTQIDSCLHWFSYRATPDILNACAQSCTFQSWCVGFPDNVFGHQFPFDGNGCAGVATSAFNNPNYREYLGVELIKAMQPGRKYFTSVYINRSDGHFSYGATNNFGFRFLKANLNRIPVDNLAHIVDTTLVTDSINWTRISGSFIADSAYEFLALGNFYDDQHTDTIDIHPGFQSSINGAYYYVDYVCVAEDSLSCSVTTNINSYNNQFDFKIFPNPFADYLELHIGEKSECELRIVDIAMRQVFHERFTSTKVFDTHELETGIYIYEVLCKGQLLKSGKIVKE